MRIILIILTLFTQALFSQEIELQYLNSKTYIKEGKNYTITNRYTIHVDRRKVFVFNTDNKCYKVHIPKYRYKVKRAYSNRTVIQLKSITLPTNFKVILTEYKN